VHPLDATPPAGGPAARDAEQPIDDRTALARMAGGDEHALGALYDRWQPIVYALAVRILGDRDDAEDVVEDTFWQLWRQAATYETSRGSVATWILTVARSRALDRRRSGQRRRTESLDARATPPLALVADRKAADPSAVTEAADTRKVVVAALADLPQEQREVVELAYFGGLSQTEIAKKTGEPLGTIKTRVRLAMQKLRAQLGHLRDEAAAR
jgi:RNA polymerase sigma-70 factor (ECF subfamily)